MDVWSLGKREEINVRAFSLEMVFKALDYALSTGTIALQRGHWFLGERVEKILDITLVCSKSQSYAVQSYLVFN